MKAVTVNQTGWYKLLCVVFVGVVCFFLGHLTRPERNVENGVNEAVSLYKLQKNKNLHHHTDLPLFVHRALLDDRFNRTILRIYALESKEGVKIDFMCSWSSKGSSSQSEVGHEVQAQKFWIDNSWPSWSPYFACEYDCPLPHGFKHEHIKFKSKDSKYEFDLPVEYTETKVVKKDIAVCLKPQTGTFSAARLVEWFEMLQLVGIPNVIVYDTDVSGAAKHVLQYYKDKHIAEIIPFPYLLSVLQKVDLPGLSGEDRYAIYQQIYLIAMHDCLYRFRGLYRHILFIDTDEMITPAKKEDSVGDVLHRAVSMYPSAAGYLFLTSWHWEEAGEVKDENKDIGNLYMQKYPKCTDPIENQPKSIIVTDRTITMNFHEVLDVPSAKFTSEKLPYKAFAYIHHFRGKCSSKFEKAICDQMHERTRLDTVIPQFKDEVIGKVNTVLEQIQLY